MRTRRISLLPVAISIAALCRVTAAPPAVTRAATGRIQGKTTEKSGGLAPRAKLVFTNTRTKGQFTTRSDSRGHYAIELEAGPYLLTAEAIGVKKYQQKDLAIKFGLVATLDVVFDPGSASQVTVSGARVVYEKEPPATGPPNRPQLIVQAGFSNGVTSVTLSPDGRLVLASSLDKTARLWEAASGREIRDFVDPEGSVKSAAFSLDARFVLTESESNDSQRIWDAATGKEVAHFDNGDSDDGLLRLVHQTKEFIVVRDSSTAREAYRFETTADDRSPDGRFLLTAENRTTEAGRQEYFVSVRNAYTREEIRRLQGHSSLVYVNAYSPDGRWIVTGGPDKTARLWDAATAKELRQFAQESTVSAIAFSPDSRLLLIGGEKTARLWETATGRMVRCMCDQKDEVQTVAFSRDGKTVLAGSRLFEKHSWMRLWNVAGGELVQPFEGNNSADRRLFLQATEERRFWTVRDKSTGAELRRFELAGARDAFSYEGPTLRQTFSPDGRLVAQVDHKDVALRDVTTGKELRRCIGHREDIYAIAFSPNGQFLLTGSGYESYLDNTVRMWDVATCKEVRRFEGYSSLPVAVSFAADGRSLAVTAGVLDSEAGPMGGGAVLPGRGYLWDLTTGQQTRSVSSGSSYRGFASFSRDGKLLLTGARGVSVLRDSTSGQQVRRFDGFPAAISPDNGWVATARKGLDIALWDASSGAKIRDLQQDPKPPANREDPDSITSLAFSPDGKSLGVGTSSGSVRIWDLVTGQVMRDLAPKEKADDGIRSVTFSSDGRSVLTTSDSETGARLWDVSTGNEIRRFAMDDDNDYRYDVTALTLSADGRRGLTWGFSSGLDQMVFEDAETPRLWDTTSSKNRELARLKGHTDDVFSAAFSPDARWVATASKDGTTRLWETATGKELCRLVTFRDGSWVAVTSEGRFDTNNLEEIQGLHWIFPDDPFRPLPLEVFMREYYEPRLVSRILAGELFRPVRSLSDLDRVQPAVKITRVDPDRNSAEWVAVTVEVSSVREKARLGQSAVVQSGIYDLRLYRDHQLVKQDPSGNGDNSAATPATNQAAGALENWRRTSLVKLDAAGHATRTFRIRIPQREGLRSVQFSAYAFNRDRVKSVTAETTYTPQRPPAMKSGKAYVIAVGVARNESQRWSLIYPANDADLLSSALTTALGDTKRYREIVPVVLASGYDDTQPDIALPTKANLRTVFDLLAGRPVPPTQSNNLPASLRQKLQPAEPEDLIVIAFSGHGNTDANGDFHIYPYDLGTDEKPPSSRLIASEDLAEWIRQIDVADIAMILDACRSGGAVGVGFRPGPMGDRGLGQLAYDKGMRILAAAPSDQDTLSIGQLHHGLLTYALAHDGLQLGLGLDKNKAFALGDWLRYGEKRVPELFKQLAAPATQAEELHPALFDFARVPALVVPNGQ